MKEKPVAVEHDLADLALLAELRNALAAVSTLGADGESTGNKAAARKVGERIAQLCQEHQIAKVVFDRNGFLYHGRVKEVADGARAGGLQF